MRWVLLVVLVVGCGKGPPAGDLRNAEFDPESAAQTLRWLAREKEAARGRIKPGNVISEKQAEEEFQQVLKATEGRRIRWKIGVSSVGQGPTFTPQTIELTHNEHRYTLSIADRGWPGEEPTFSGAKVTPEFQAWLKTAGRGDEFVVSGVIGSWWTRERPDEQDERRKHFRAIAYIHEVEFLKP